MLVLAFVGTTALAAVEATLTQTTIGENDTVQLVIRSDSDEMPSPPDFSVLEDDFEVGSPASRNEYSNISGRISNTASWSVTLRPKRTGTLTIPALDVGVLRTRPLTLTVNPLAPETRSALARQVFFETTTEPESPYVQAQLKVTRRMFYVAGTQLYGQAPEAPELSGAVVKQLGDARSFREDRDGRTYGVLEQVFAIFPERSGTLTLPEVVVTASTPLPGQRRRTALRVRAEPVDIEVKPIPASYPAGRPWFPASHVELRQTWTPQLTPLAVGDTRTRTLTVTATGAVASVIPPLEAVWPDAFKVYPEPEVLDDAAHAGQVIGSRIESHAAIATVGGPATLPTVSVHWWDTDTDELKTATMPGVTIQVEGVVLESLAATEAAPSVTGETSGVRPSDVGVGGNAEREANEIDAGANFWRAGAIVGWLLVGALALCLVWQHRRDRSDHQQPPAAPKRVGRRPNEAALRSLLNDDDLPNLKALLGEWLATHLGTSTRDAWHRFGANPDGAVALASLNAALYGPNPSSAAAAVDRAALRDAAMKVAAPAASTSPDALPPLYEHAAAASRS